MPSGNLALFKLKALLYQLRLGPAARFKPKELIQGNSNNLQYINNFSNFFRPHMTTAQMRQSKNFNSKGRSSTMISNNSSSGGKPSKSGAAGSSLQRKSGQLIISPTNSA
jgi:hypothetical protein